jgi:hypothetical protein
MEALFFFYYSLFFYGQCTGQKNNEAQGTTVLIKFSKPDHLNLGFASPCIIILSTESMVGFVANRPDHDQQHCYHQAPTVNQRLLLQLYLLMMGMRMPETC